MSSCPFCNAPIDDVAARFGGRCPNCFIEIPGEEAQTNPGLKRAEGEGATKRKRRGRRILTASFGVVVVAAGTGWFVIRGHESAQGASILNDADFGSFYMVPLRDIEAANGDPSGQTPPSQRGTSRKGSSYMARRIGNEVPGTSVQIGAASDVGMQPEVTQDTVPQENPAQESGSPDAGAQENNGVASASGGATSDNPNGPSMRSDGTINIRAPQVEAPKEEQNDTEVKEQVWDLVKDYSRQIQACYERRLKFDNSLKGAWLVSLVVGKDGRPSKVWATGQTMRDKDLEECMMTRALSWRFPPMAEPMTFEVPYRLGL